MDEKVWYFFININLIQMELIEWNEKYSLNIKVLDEQHRILIDMVNELYIAINEGKGNLVLGDMLSRLISYSIEHFTTEEKYFEQYSYPEANFHKEEHLNFIQKVTDFRDSFDEGKMGLSIDVLNFLKTWVKTHIFGSDRKFGPFFNERGLF